LQRLTLKTHQAFTQERSDEDDDDDDDDNDNNDDDYYSLSQSLLRRLRITVYFATQWYTDSRHG